MRARLIQVSCVLAFVGSMALAEDAGDPKLPFNPFTDAKEGDWATYAVSGDPREGPPSTMTFRVGKVTDDEVTIMQDIQSADRPKPETDTRTASRKGLPTLGEVMGEKGGALTGVKTTEEKHKVGGREFDCTKISFTEKAEGGKEGASFTIWFSRVVKVRCLVEMQVFEGPSKQEVTFRLVGYGNGDKAEWGMLPKDNLAGEGQRRLPLNPFAKAKEGDWATYAGSLTNDKGNKSNLSSTFRITSVSEDVVKVSVRRSEDEGADESSYSTKEAPTIVAFLHGKAGHMQVTGVKFAQEKHKAGDHEFDCWKVVFKSYDPFAGACEGTLWVSEEVKCAGLVEMRYASDKEGPFLVLKLTGFGTGDKADWGAAPEKR